MTQKQWILSILDLSHLSMSVATEIESHKQGRIVEHHLRNLEELAAKLAAIRENIARVYSDENDMDGEPCERLLVTLIDQQYSDWWDEEPYTVIPVGEKYAVVCKDTLRPVNEQLYKHSTHAYRACRRLNADYRENEAVSEQLGSIRKLCEELNKPEPENITGLTYASARKLIQKLTAEITQHDRRFIVYIIGNGFVALPVSINMQPQHVDKIINTNNWYGTECATDKDSAILEALAGGFGKSLNIVWEQGKSPVIQG